MAQTYKTRDGDTVDYIAWRRYGRTDGEIVERILAENPGLSDLGSILSAGITITLPDIATPSKLSGVKLWD